VSISQEKYHWICQKSQKKIWKIPQLRDNSHRVWALALPPPPPNTVQRQGSGGKKSPNPNEAALVGKAV